MMDQGYASVVMTLSLLGGLQGVLMAATLFSLRHGPYIANRFLGLLMLGPALELLVYVLYLKGIPERYPHLLGVIEYEIFAVPPLLYFYVLALSKPTFRLSWRLGWHFLPVIAAIIVGYGPIYLASAEQKLAIMHNVSQGVIQAIPWQYRFPVYQPIFSSLQAIVYFMLIYRLLARHSHNIRQIYSSIDRINLRWLWYLCAAVFTLWLLYQLTVGLPLLLKMPFDIKQSALVDALLVLFIYSIGYMAISQPVIFKGWEYAVLLAHRITQQGAEENISDKDSAAWADRLERAMAERKLYTDSELTIVQLAQIIGVSPSQLLCLISKQFQQDFFDYINSYRIEYAKTLLADPKEDSSSLLAIALEVGFGAKSSFLKAFKRAVGMSPAEYKKQMQQAAIGP